MKEFRVDISDIDQKERMELLKILKKAGYSDKVYNETYNKRSGYWYGDKNGDLDYYFKTPYTEINFINSIVPEITVGDIKKMTSTKNLKFKPFKIDLTTYNQAEREILATHLIDLGYSIDKTDTTLYFISYSWMSDTNKTISVFDINNYNVMPGEEVTYEEIMSWNDIKKEPADIIMKDEAPQCTCPKENFSLWFGDGCKCGAFQKEQELRKGRTP